MFLRDLMKEVEDVDLTTVSEPEREVEEGDRAVGVLPDWLKKLYAVYLTYEAKAEHYKKTYGWFTRMAAKLDETEVERDIWQAHKNYKFVKYLFWYSIEETFPEVLGANLIALRKGWQVVIVGSIFDLFKSIRSGGFFHM